MKKLVIITCCLLSFTAFAQVGINTTNPDPNSLLEISSTNKGFLKPRVNLTSTASPAPLTNHVEGMEVYNKATVNDVTPGMYYNDGTRWFKQEAEIDTYLVGPFDILSNQYLRYNINDPDVLNVSVVSWNFMGNLPNGPIWGYEVTVIPEARNGTIRFHITNASVYNITNLRIVYTIKYRP